MLEGRLQPPFEAGHGLPLDHLAGVPRMRSCRFTGLYPFAFVEMSDRDVPVEVTLEAFNPLVPGDPDASAFPVAVLRYHLRNRARSKVKVSLCYSVPNPVGAEGKRNLERGKGRVRGVLLGNRSIEKDDPAFGTLALGVRGGRRSVARRLAFLLLGGVVAVGGHAPAGPGVVGAFQCPALRAEMLRMVTVGSAAPVARTGVKVRLRQRPLE